MVDYVRYWTDQAETPAKRILAWMGVPEGTYYNWRKRYGKVNEHKHDAVDDLGYDEPNKSCYKLCAYDDWEEQFEEC